MGVSRRSSKAFPAGRSKESPMLSRFEGNYRNRLPPDLAMTAQINRASLLAAAVASGDARLASHQDVARHEAGHVVGYALLGVGTRRCWVRRFKRDWIGRTQRYGLPVWGAPLGHEGRFMTPPAGIAQAVSCLSGPLAERAVGGGEGLANFAADLPEMLEGFAMLRLSVALALFPDALPSDDGAEALVEAAFRDMGHRLHASLLGELRRWEPESNLRWAP